MWSGLLARPAEGSTAMTTYAATTNRDDGERIYDGDLAIAEIIIHEIIQDPGISSVTIAVDDGRYWHASCDDGGFWSCTSYDEDGRDTGVDELADWLDPWSLVVVDVEGRPYMITDRWHEVGDLYGSDDVERALGRITAIMGGAEGYDPEDFEFTSAVDLRKVAAGKDLYGEQEDVCWTGQECILL